jgi:hypothetical protein
MEVIPWAAEDVFAGAVHRYCQAAAVEELLSDYIDRVATEEGVEKIPTKLFDALNVRSHRTPRSAISESRARRSTKVALS